MNLHECACTAEVLTVGPTGVEIEALQAVQSALLSIYGHVQGGRFSHVHAGHTPLVERGRPLGKLQGARPLSSLVGGARPSVEHTGSAKVLFECGGGGLFPVPEVHVSGAEAGASVAAGLGKFSVIRAFVLLSSGFLINFFEKTGQKLDY